MSTKSLGGHNSDKIELVFIRVRWSFSLCVREIFQKVAACRWISWKCGKVYILE